MAENNRPVKHGERDENGGAHKETDRAARVAARRRRGAWKGLNLFDVLVIVLVLTVVVLLAVGVSVGDLFGGDDTQTVRLSYTLTLYGVDEAYADAIRLGDEIYDVDTGALLGVVAQTPTVTPHTEVALQASNDGTASAVELPVPGRINITVAVRGEVQYLAGEGYSAGGHDIRIGKTYAVRFPDYLGSALCVGLEGRS